MSSDGGSFSSGSARAGVRRSPSSRPPTGYLRQPDDARFVAHLHVVDGVGTVDHLDVLRGLTRGALDLFVAFVADEDDVVVVAGESFGLLVHLGDQRAGRVDGAQAALGSGLVHFGRDSVCREHHDGAFGHLVGLVDEDRTAFDQGVDHVPVVHDLLADINRGTVLVEGPLDCFHGPVDACTISTGRREKDALTISHEPQRTSVRQ